MSIQRIRNGERCVLVKVYISPSGYVAHWFTHSGKHIHENLKSRYVMTGKGLKLYLEVQDGSLEWEVKDGWVYKGPAAAPRVEVVRVEKGVV